MVATIFGVRLMSADRREELVDHVHDHVARGTRDDAHRPRRRNGPAGNGIDGRGGSRRDVAAGRAAERADHDAEGEERAAARAGKTRW